MDRDFIERVLNNKSETLIQLSDEIWGYAEHAFKEFKSSEAHRRVLKNEGFSIEDSTIPNAFVASFGSGEPVIGFLGEYDALPGLSQESDSLERMPLDGAEYGHGCGHNLLGTGNLGAALILKEYLLESGKSGTVKYFGCPAEEGKAGKVYMIREGMFEGTDLCLSWHPGSENIISSSMLAIVGSFFEFYGKSAHAAFSPHEGRSALDGAELMNIGANFLREHVKDDVRISYAFINSGGKAPNIIPDYAKLNYTLRAQDSSELKDILGRVQDIAKGAGLMTGTEVKGTVHTGYSEFIPNDTLDALLIKYMKENPIEYSESEIEYGRKYKDLGGDAGSEVVYDMTVQEERRVIPASSDVADVSWVVPTSHFLMTCFPVGVPLHSWLTTAMGKSSPAHKGMLNAARVLACTAVELVEDSELLREVKREHELALKGRTYESIIPADRKPYEEV